MLVKIEQEGGIKSIKIAEASDGLNAYQLAVKNDGFVGDYDAWKVTHKGDKGDPGNDANVTSANIATALSYTPADDVEVAKLSGNQTIRGVKTLKEGVLKIEESASSRTLEIRAAVSGLPHRITSPTTSAGYRFENNSGTLFEVSVSGKFLWVGEQEFTTPLKVASAIETTQALNLGQAKSLFLERQLRMIPKPSGFSYVPFNIVKYNNKAFLDNDDFLDLFRTKYTSLVSNSAVYVDPIKGNDANNGSIFAPYKTMAKGMDGAGSYVYLFSGTYDMIDFRDTNTRGHVAKVIIGLTDEVYFKFSGDNISNSIFTNDATTITVFHTTLTTDNPINRLLRNDILDQDGNPTPLPLKASATEVGSSGYGWYYDLATKKLTVRLGMPTGINATEREQWFHDNIRPHLIGSYTGTTLQNSRFYIQNTKVFLKNIKIEGAYILTSKTAATIDSIIPTLWCENVEMLYSPYVGFMIDGAEFFSKDTYVTRSRYDNFGYHVQLGIECKAVEYKALSTYPGDADTYPGSTPSQNCSSMHENGTVLRINGEYRNGFAYAVVDTGINGTSTGGSWNIGIKASGSSSRDIIMYDRTVYLDHVQAKTITASTGSSIVHNDLVVGTLTSEGTGTLTQYTF